jgi:hypothetical protein
VRRIHAERIVPWGLDSGASSARSVSPGTETAVGWRAPLYEEGLRLLTQLASSSVLLRTSAS